MQTARCNDVALDTVGDCFLALSDRTAPDLSGPSTTHLVPASGRLKRNPPGIEHDPGVYADVPVIERQVGIRDRASVRTAGQKRIALRLPLIGLRAEERVRRELGAYLEQREGFPTPRQFHADGRWELQRALTELGGMERWAAEFGRELGRRQRPGPEWTEERIEAALRTLTAKTGRFPTRDQFYAARMPGLHNAVRGAGERERWARKLGLAVSPRRAGPRCSGTSAA
jgi:hypothetical protein